MEWKIKLAQLGFTVLQDDKPQLYLRQLDVEKFIEQNFVTQQQVCVEPVVMPEIADINKMKMFDIIRLNRDEEFMRVPNGYVLTIYRLDRNQMNSVFIPE